MKAGNLDEAEKLFETARRDDPYHTKWITKLARVHLRKKNVDKFLDDQGRSVVQAECKMTNQLGTTLATAKAEMELPKK